MKPSLIISFVILVVVVIITSLLFFGGGNREGRFKTDPPKVVTRVIIQKADSRVNLEMKKGEWLLNGKVDVRKSAISFMLSALEGMEPRSSVSEKVFESLSSKSTGDYLTVKVFSGYRKINSFIVYHFQDVNYSSILKKNSRSKPYLVYLPGYEFDPGMIFTAETDYWRPFTIFEIMPSEIKEVRMDYNTNSLNSFAITSERTLVSLSGSSSFDSIAVRRYLSYFVNVPFERFPAGLELNDMKKQTSGSPYFTLTVSAITGTTHILKGWKREIVADGVSITDTDRLWGQLDEGKLFVMRYLDIDPLLKKRSYFLPDE